VAGVTDVLQASTAVLDAEARAIAARVDVMVGHSLLRRALGRNP
jgi:outer membrane protein TolC